MFEREKEVEIDFFKIKPKPLSKWKKITSFINDLKIKKPVDWLASSLLISIVFGFSKVIDFNKQIEILSSMDLNQSIYGFYMIFFTMYFIKLMFICQFKYHGEPLFGLRKSLIVILQQAFIAIIFMPIMENKITPAMHVLTKVIKYLFIH